MSGKQGIQGIQGRRKTMRGRGRKTGNNRKDAGYKLRKMMNKMTAAAWLTAAVIITATVWCSAMTARCESAGGIANDENEYYDAAEKTYIRNMRQYLDTHGCRNSGITLTSVSDGEGRHYTAEIHSDCIERMGTDDISRLRNGISTYEFRDGRTDFTYTLY